MAGFSRVLGAALYGVDGVAVEVEVRLSSHLPRVEVVGLPEAAVRESAARVRAAIASSGHPFPQRRVTVNLAPAGLRKSGAGLDLPIAVGILAAAGAIPPEKLAGLGLLGELALDGRLRAVRGALPLAIALQRAGSSRVVGPVASAAELGLAREGAVEVASSLAEVMESLLVERALAVAKPAAAPPPAAGVDLSVVRGQAHARRAVEIAAAGGHGLLLRGAPGTGKTLLARTLPGLLPPLEATQALEVTRIHSAAGLLDPDHPALIGRPFRAPHHSASRAGLLGGGSPPTPGEVSLAHLGVLFLDELPEFEHRALESLRQVLEDGHVQIARATGRFRFPARFQLVAAANPCPCGFFRSGVRDCRCDDAAIGRYDARLSGPLLDRIDLHVHARPIPFAELDGPPGVASHEVALRVAAARRRQMQRLAARGFETNSQIPAEQLAELAPPHPEARALLGRSVERLGISARGAHRVLRVARTVADLAGEAQIGPQAMAEALGLRFEAAPSSLPESWRR